MPSIYPDVVFLHCFLQGLNCNYVVARRPEGLPTSNRAVPVAIFSTEPAIARAFLRKWTHDSCNGALNPEI